MGLDKSNRPSLQKETPAASYGSSGAGSDNLFCREIEPIARNYYLAPFVSIPKPSKITGLRSHREAVAVCSVAPAPRRSGDERVSPLPKSGNTHARGERGILVPPVGYFQRAILRRTVGRSGRRSEYSPAVSGSLVPVGIGYPACGYLRKKVATYGRGGW